MDKLQFPVNHWFGTIVINKAPMCSRTWGLPIFPKNTILTDFISLTVIFSKNRKLLANKWLVLFF